MNADARRVRRFRMSDLTFWIKLSSRHTLRSQADMSLYNTDIEFFWNIFILLLDHFMVQVTICFILSSIQENIEERRRERREKGLDSSSRFSDRRRSPPRRERDRDDRDRRESRHGSGSSRRRSRSRSNDRDRRRDRDRDDRRGGSGRDRDRDRDRRDRR
ncbi:hypothetical protein KIN20_035187 [Parelaphostrongylus tenuis]|uniref:Uncharacterized protein n=1 Tax=Parelaphostrongylus tenuis TaxID=148309 RepID=A0AAD5RB36_PARTN|nr:hypothetical protein KIN20_035187 [Parelaphostrongylus tenuis]